MLDRVDRIQMAVAEAAPATRVFQDILYMCYAETDDVDAIIRRLGRHHTRFTPRGGDPLTEWDGLWIHSSARSSASPAPRWRGSGRGGPSSLRTNPTTTEAPS
jgi:hypothetical protein